MADIALAASAEPSRPATITAISSHGLLPHEHTPLQPEVLKADVSPLLFQARSLRQVVDATRLLVNDIESRGGDWRDVIALLRDAAPVVWQRLSPENRRRFRRHVQAYWSIHRHRLPPEIAARLADLRRSGHLLDSCGPPREPNGRRTDPRSLRLRGTTDTVSDSFDVVVNGTGPTTGPIRCSPHRRFQRAAGCYLGPRPGGDDFEATSVPELRVRAERLASSPPARTACRATPESSNRQPGTRFSFRREVEQTAVAFVAARVDLPSSMPARTARVLFAQVRAISKAAARGGVHDLPGNRPSRDAARVGRGRSRVRRRVDEAAAVQAWRTEAVVVCRPSPVLAEIEPVTAPASARAHSAVTICRRPTGR